MSSKISKAALSSLIPDHHNANRGTERGSYMIRESVGSLGMGRSILVDKNGRVIAGNKTLEAAVDAGIEDVIIVPSDGKSVTAVQRMDMDLTDKKGDARRMAYIDNRVPDVGIEFDPEIIKSDIEDGLDLGDMWFDWEMDNLISGGDVNDAYEEWEAMPEYNSEDKSKALKSVIVHIHSEEDLAEFARRIGQKVTMDTRSIHFPKVPDIPIDAHEVKALES